MPAVGHADDVVYLDLAARPHAEAALDAGVEGDAHRGMRGIGRGRDSRTGKRLPPRVIRSVQRQKPRCVLVGGGAGRLIGEQEFEHGAARMAARSVSVRTFIPGAGRRMHEAARTRSPSTSTCTPGSCRPGGSRARPSGKDGGSRSLRAPRLARGSPRRRRHLAPVQTEGDCLAHVAVPLIKSVLVPWTARRGGRRNAGLSSWPDSGAAAEGSRWGGYESLRSSDEVRNRKNQQGQQCEMEGRRLGVPFGRLPHQEPFVRDHEEAPNQTKRASPAPATAAALAR